jgi:peroxiredoxin
MRWFMDKRHANNQRGGVTMFASIIVCAGVVLAALAFSAFNGSGNEAASPATGHEDVAKSSAPDFKLKDLKGKEAKLSDYRGKVVVVNFWAAWCGPCVIEIPSFVKLRGLYQDRGLEIIGISLDGEDTEAMTRFAKRFKINYPIVMGTQEAVEAYGPMHGIPSTFIIDREGRVHSRHLGMVSFEKLEGTVKPLF